MTHACQSCNSELITDGLNPGQQIRCAHCLTISTFGKVEKVATDRLAWRSLWLGLSSIVFLFLTGIPAVYYGIKSLLRMRFVKPKRSDRAAAIAGTTLGGCFGICMGLAVAAGLMIAGLIWWTSDSTSDQTEVVRRCNRVFDFEPPSGVEPIVAKSVLNSQQYFEFSDSPEIGKRFIRIHLVNHKKGLQVNKSQFISTLGSRILRANRERKEVSNEILQWELNGELIDIKKTVFSAQNADPSLPESERTVEVQRYFGFFFIGQEWYGMAIIFEPENFELSEAQVRDIFANTYVAGAGKDDSIDDSSSPD